MAKAVKSRYWSAIAWCDSVPDDWIENIKRSGLPCVISPIHDKDIEEETGKPQKSHYHVILGWDGPTTLDSAREFCEVVGLGSYVERVRSISNILNYLTHDSYKGDGKARYDVKDIQYINSVESDWVKLGFKKIIAFIKDRKIKSFNKLVDVLFEENEDDLLEFLSNKAYFVNLYLSSLKIDVDRDLKQCFMMLKGYADEIDKRGKITVNKKDYFRLLEYFEQLDIWCNDYED